MSTLPTEIGYNDHSLDRANSTGEIPYDASNASGFMSNDYNATNMNGESVAPSPSPYPVIGFNTNGYAGYHENGSVLSTNGNGSTLSSGHENGGTGNGYNGNDYVSNQNSGTQFVRKRLLPTLPKGNTLFIHMVAVCIAHCFNILLAIQSYQTVPVTFYSKFALKEVFRGELLQ